ncbi:MAG: sugar phosphate isomerase/epimerase [Caldilineaceae bacterium]|nr:sugar phosphate isomerase/epimerase [Caldilineaceae bacterium]MDE0336868.1 sugar phosphate isomerase/epimerase [Caldilineaceae bacterium]
MSDYSRLAINQFTTLQQWSLPQAIEGYARHGVHAIGIVRDKLQEVGVGEAGRWLKAHDMTVTCLCICGLLTDSDNDRFQANLNESRRAIDEAAELGAECIVFVAGGLPEGSRDLPAARARCLEGLSTLLPYAKQSGVTLALEPLHPMICSFRSCLSTLGQANDWIDALGAGPELGIVVDVYHVWWDPDMEREIERSAGRIVSFHVCDWLMDTTDLRLDRGMMGDGVINIRRIRRLVEATGYDGYREVEIFSERNWWRRDPDEVVEITKARYLSYVI